MGKKVNSAAAPDQGGAATPDVKPDAGDQQQGGEQGANQGGTDGDAGPSEREKQLTAELADATAQRDAYQIKFEALQKQADDELQAEKDAHASTAIERNDYKAQLDLRSEHDAPSGDAADAGNAADDHEQPAGELKPYDEAEVKDALIRNGLTKAWVMPSGNICFTEAHAKAFVGEADFASLTVITAE